MKLYTIQQAGELLSMSRSAVYGLMRSGELPYIKMTPGPRGAIRFTEDDIVKFINAHKVDYQSVSAAVLSRI